MKGIILFLLQSFKAEKYAMFTLSKDRSNHDIMSLFMQLISEMPLFLTLLFYSPQQMFGWGRGLPPRPISPDCIGFLMKETF